MSTGKPHPDHVRAAAIADYHEGTESLQAVADRHGVSKGALAAWVNPNIKPRGRNWSWSEAELAYRGGWEVRGGVRYPLLPEQRSA